ncbi:MAG: hypothetical protein RL711_2090, partial [Bacteroidota bacterium]
TINARLACCTYADPWKIFGRINEQTINGILKLFIDRGTDNNNVI